MAKCPRCNSIRIEKTEVDQTEDGAEVYELRCSGCGHSWQEEG